jgi:hypothetical protein
VLDKIAGCFYVFLLIILIMGIPIEELDEFKQCFRENCYRGGGPVSGISWKLGKNTYAHRLCGDLYFGDPFCPVRRDSPDIKLVDVRYSRNAFQSETSRDSSPPVQ